MAKNNSEELVKKLTEMIDIIKKNDEPLIEEPVSKCTECPLKKMSPENKQNILESLKDCKKGMCIIKFDLDEIDEYTDSEMIIDDQMENRSTQQDWVSNTFKSSIISLLILVLFILIFSNILKIIRTSAL